MLLRIARGPGVRLRDIAAGPGSTERSAYGIVTDLTAAGYAAKQKDGSRNRCQRLRPPTSRRSWRMTGTSSRMRPEAGKVIFEPGFCDPVGLGNTIRVVTCVFPWQRRVVMRRRSTRG